MQEVVIVGAVRTPIGSFRGVFSTLSAVDLGVGVVRSLLARCSLPATAVDELIFGQVLTAGAGRIRRVRRPCAPVCRSAVRR